MKTKNKIIITALLACFVLLVYGPITATIVLFLGVLSLIEWGDA